MASWVVIRFRSKGMSISTSWATRSFRAGTSPGVKAGSFSTVTFRVCPTVKIHLGNGPRVELANGQEQNKLHRPSVNLPPPGVGIAQQSDSPTGGLHSAAHGRRILLLFPLGDIVQSKGLPQQSAPPEGAGTAPDDPTPTGAPHPAGVPPAQPQPAVRQSTNSYRHLLKMQGVFYAIIRKNRPMLQGRTKKNGTALPTEHDISAVHLCPKGRQSAPPIMT